jgi:tRNA-dihydrouridine synthase
LSRPVLALAPMQDVTDLSFWRVIAMYGGADLYFTEYFRVYAGSQLDRSILESVIANPTGRPVIAQMIGNDVSELVRTARELQRYPIAGVDLNLGCPAPIVYRKCAGGGLLRDPGRIDSLLGALRDAIGTRFTVKTRTGFDSPAAFDELLHVYARHDLDLLTVHGRTVHDMYRTEVRYDLIAQAVKTMPCPVLANGNIYSGERAAEVLRGTSAAGVMIGRGAIRNPWIFHQVRQQLNGEKPFVPTGLDVLQYITTLYQTVRAPGHSERGHIARMKKYMNYIGLGVEPSGQFLHSIRRVESEAGFFALCERFLNHDQPMPLDPFRLELQRHDVMAGEQC